MKLNIDLLAGLTYILSLVGCKETYLYEKRNFFGLGRRLFQKPKQTFIINVNSGHPEPLPTEEPPVMMTPFRSLYQGVRNKTDKRVFRRRFEYDAQDKGHQILCEGIFDCYITFLAIESTEAIPVLLRGGAGYRHFSAVVKARPGRELKGQVRAYCKQDESEETILRRSIKRSMKHKKSLIEPGGY